MWNAFHSIQHVYTPCIYTDVHKNIITNWTVSTITTSLLNSQSVVLCALWLQDCTITLPSHIGFSSSVFFPWLIGNVGFLSSSIWNLLCSLLELFPGWAQSLSSVEASRTVLGFRITCLLHDIPAFLLPNVGFFSYLSYPVVPVIFQFIRPGCSRCLCSPCYEF